MLEDAVRFFKEEPGYHRLLVEIIKKYKQLGRVGGIVELHDLTHKEKSLLESIFAKNYTFENSTKINIKKFADNLTTKTKFKGIDFVKLLERYQNQKIISNKDAKEIAVIKRNSFLANFRPLCKNQYSNVWLDCILSKNSGTKAIYQLYNKNSGLLNDYIVSVINALNLLPLAEYIRLPVFAAKVTGNPHSFDITDQQGQFFLMALQIIRNYETGEEIKFNLSTEDKTDLMEEYKIVRDDLLNFVMCAGLVAYNDEKVNSVFAGSVSNNIVLNTPLREILKISKFEPKNNRNVVFVLENSGVCSAILDYFDADHPPLICTYGQGKLATRIVLERLVNSGAKILYSGDFDPEGLIMADKLKRQYPNSVELWRYSEDEYLVSLSHERIDEQRLKQLNSVTSEDLLPVCQQMIAKRRVGFQEQILNLLIKDIEERMS